MKRFSLTLADLGGSENFSGDMVLTEGVLAGKTVSEVLRLSNKTLNGADTGYYISDLNAALSMITENYVGVDNCSSPSI